MNRTLNILLLSAVLFTACKQAPDYKTIRTEVLKEHDQVMMDSELAFKNRMKLDTLSKRMDSLLSLNPGMDTAAEMQKINSLKDQLNQADDEMTDWMQKFDAELGSKSNEEAVAYFNAEKLKIRKLDSLFKESLKASNEYLLKKR